VRTCVIPLSAITCCTGRFISQTTYVKHTAKTVVTLV
jgi:hypothetical protein